MKLIKSRESLFQSSQESHLNRPEQAQADPRTFSKKSLLNESEKTIDGQMEPGLAMTLQLITKMTTLTTLRVIKRRMDKATSVQVMRVTAGSPRWQTNGQTAGDLAELHKAWIHGEALVAAMVEWLWSWAVIT